MGAAQASGTSSAESTMGAAQASGTSSDESTIGAAQASDYSEKQAESKPTAPPAAPHMFKEIIATATDPDPAVVEGKVYLLEGNKKKYWVKNNRNYFKVLARGLKIVWGSTPAYWTWKPLEGEEGIEVAELLQVWWMEFDGKMEMSHLTPGVVYRVVLEIMMKQESYGWTLPLKLRLKTPYGSIVQERTEPLRDKPREQWLDIVVGDIKVHKGQRGDLFFAFSQLDSVRKGGLIIKGVRITPRQEKINLS